MKLIGLLISDNEVDIIPKWIENSSDFYDAVYGLVKGDDGTFEEIKKHPKVAYLEREENVFKLPLSGTAEIDSKTRGFVFEKIKKDHGDSGYFIQLVHPDELYIDSPRSYAELAEEKGYGYWFYHALQMFIHKSQKPEFERTGNAIPKWVGLGFREFRAFRVKPNLRYGTSGINPIGCSAPHNGDQTVWNCPAYQHFSYRSALQMYQRALRRRAAKFAWPQIQTPNVDLKSLDAFIRTCPNIFGDHQSSVVRISREWHGVEVFREWQREGALRDARITKQGRKPLRRR